MLNDPSDGMGQQLGGANDGGPTSTDLLIGDDVDGPLVVERSDGTESDASGQPQLKTSKGLHPIHWLVDGHWLGRRRTPLLLRLWRYGAGSIVAFVTSVVAVYVCYSLLHLGAITASTIAFFAGAIPNWILNRRWAWQKRGREGVGRETGMYVAVSLLSWLASTAVTKLAATESAHVDHLARGLLVTASYMFSVVVLTGLKFVAYDRWVFANRQGARRSRHQVPSTTEQNLNP
jgi:putative flippase GtrA